MMGRLKKTLINKLVFTTRKLIGTVTHFAISDPIAALTFDDGPHPEYTPRLLDILDRFGVRATFFIVGRAAESYPELIQAIGQAGHAIGNHSWDHPLFTSITGKERRDQIRACERAISPYGQRIFRAPWGKENIASWLDALWLRYEVIAWNVEVGDWWDQNSRRMTDLLTSRIRPGSVILLHDSIICNPSADQEPMPYIDREPMLLALDFFLERLGQSFRFATIPEMFRLGRPIRRAWL